MRKELRLLWADQMNFAYFFKCYKDGARWIYLWTEYQLWGGFCSNPEASSLVPFWGNTPYALENLCTSAMMPQNGAADRQQLSFMILTQFWIQDQDQKGVAIIFFFYEPSEVMQRALPGSLHLREVGRDTGKIENSSSPISSDPAQCLYHEPSWMPRWKSSIYILLINNNMQPLTLIFYSTLFGTTLIRTI